MAIDLSVKRGITYLSVLKAENRNMDTLNKAFKYWSKDLNVTFEGGKRVTGVVDLGSRVKELRSKLGLSQAELANLVGVTPSTISQVKSNLIYPSLPALLKMAEVLSVEVSSFFQDRLDIKSRVIFPSAEAVEVKFPDLPEGSIHGKLLTQLDNEPKAEPYIIEIPPNKSLPSHFFIHKGDELGYVLAGTLKFKLEKAVFTVRAGDVIYLTSEMPSQWKNPGDFPARLLWMKIKQPILSPSFVFFILTFSNTNVLSKTISLSNGSTSRICFFEAAVSRKGVQDGKEKKGCDPRPGI